MNIGTMRQIGDEIEAKVLFPVYPYHQREHRFPGGAKQFELNTDRLHCGWRAQLRAGMGVLLPDGTMANHQTGSPQIRRRKAGPVGPLGPDPRRLICWTASFVLAGKLK